MSENSATVREQTPIWSPDQPWVLHLVSHTHWDREWYLSFQQYRFRFVRLMDELLTIFKEQPSYKHFTLDGQTIILKDYLEIRPERRDEIEALVRSGRLQIGPWYSQPNVFLVSGEALIRNLMLGFREGADYGGVMTVCYLPDVFGLCTQLPQILKGFDISDVVAWRGMPAGTKTALMWEGADGTECAFFYMRTNYGEARALPLTDDAYMEVIDDTTTPRQGLAERINSNVTRLGRISTSPHLLLMNGVDHAFPQYELPEVIERINAMPQLQAIHSSFPVYIRAVKEYHATHGVELGRLRGELRDHAEGEILPGSQSTRVPVKQFNRQIEGLFEKWMEPFAAVSWLLGGTYPHAEIWRAWEYLLENHAHDSMVCSSVDSTYHQVMTRFEWAWELGDEIAQHSLQHIASLVNSGDVGKTLVVFNPLNWERSEVLTTTVDIPVARHIKNLQICSGATEVPVVVHSIVDDLAIVFNPREGIPSKVPVRRFAISFAADHIPANGYRSFTLTDAPRQRYLPGQLGVTHNVMENSHLRVEVQSNGTLDILDRRSGHQFIGLNLFEDSGEAGDGFSHIAPAQDRVVLSSGTAPVISWIENTALRAALKIDFWLDLPVGLAANRQSRAADSVRCAVTSIVSLTASAARVDVETHVTNRAKDHRLRVLFPSGIDAAVSYAEQPFDIVQRQIALPDLNKEYRESPYPTHPQLSFAGVTDGIIGLMIGNSGQYEYEVIDNQERSLALTLLRCTDRMYNPAFKGSRQNLIPEAQCLGDHVFRYSIIPHMASMEAAWQEAYAFSTPLRAIIERTLEGATLRRQQASGLARRLPAAHQFLEVSTDRILVTAIKKAERADALIVRLANITSATVSGRARLSFPGHDVRRACRLTLNEMIEEDVPVAEDGWVRFQARAKEIVTLGFFV